MDFLQHGDALIAFSFVTLLKELYIHVNRIYVKKEITIMWIF